MIKAVLTMLGLFAVMYIPALLIGAAMQWLVMVR